MSDEKKSRSREEKMADMRAHCAAVMATKLSPEHLTGTVGKPEIDKIVSAMKSAVPDGVGAIVVILDKEGLSLVGNEVARAVGQGDFAAILAVASSFELEMAEARATIDAIHGDKNGRGQA